MRSRPTLLLLTLLLLPSCVGTAVPQPPNLMPIDPERVSAMQPEMAGAPLQLDGAAGAAPEGAEELFIWDLGAPTPVVVTPIAADGSFSVTLPDPAGALRLQARAEGARSEPVDVAAGETSLVLARPACLVVEREHFLGDERARALELVNDCASEVTLGASRLRAGEGFVIDRPTSLTLPPGTRAEIGISAPGTGATEEILLLELELEATTYLYAVTLSAPEG